MSIEDGSVIRRMPLVGGPPRQLGSTGASGTVPDDLPPECIGESGQAL
jgi:hypothetical protein